MPSPSPRTDDARNPFDVLTERGFIQDSTDPDALRELLERERVTYYVGFDPTAPSLHIGNLVGIMAMRWLQRYGHRAIALVGGATGRIGDPSGRDTERSLLDLGTIDRNLERIREQLSRFLVLDDPDRGTLRDNHDWFGAIGFLDFLRDVGKHFSVNAMIARESVKRRLEAREQGISYTEFSYQLLQAYDFAHLHEMERCRLQGGGSDQWGNITAGVDLTRRLHDAEVHGIVWPLLETTGGQKVGKSAGNATWLDPEMTSPYLYYQWWMNTHDEDVERFLALFTELEMDDIRSIVAAHREEPSARTGQRRLAEETTRIAHGEGGLEAARRATTVLFGRDAFTGLDDRTLREAFEAAPSRAFPREQLDEGIGLLDLMRELGATSSTSEARRLVDQGAVRVNNVRVEDAARELGADDLAGEATLVLRVGRKRYFLARFDG
jgi:tyrosyl-tRNA synthetase